MSPCSTATISSSTPNAGRSFLTISLNESRRLVELAGIEREADALGELAALAEAGDERAVGLGLPVHLVLDALADALDLLVKVRGLGRGEARPDRDADEHARCRREDSERERESKGEPHRRGTL